MATNFPTSLDALPNPVPGGPGVGTDVDAAGDLKHTAQHINVNDAVEALEAKVGVDGSAVASSLDYKIAAMPSPFLLMGA